jgi:glycine/D-amino acid oxidase-like deaminating enzyme
MLQINHLSYWEKREFFNQIDFLIVGAGIVGYSTAINLRKLNPNSKIVLIERGYLPTGASSKNAGFTCFGSPSEIMDDLKNCKEDLVWQTVQMRFDGLKELFQIVQNHDIGYEKNGSWELIKNNDTQIDNQFIKYLNDKCEKLFHVKNVYKEDTTSFRKFGFKNIQTTYFNSEEGQLDTGKLIRALHWEANLKGIISLFGIELLSYEENRQSVETETSIGLLSCQKLIICTNGFAGQFIGNDVRPARAQVLVTKPIENLNFKGTFHIDKGYYYFRNVDDRILLGGGRNLDFEGETTTEIEVTQKIQDSLIELLKNTIIPNSPFEIEHQWAGIMGVGENKFPIIRKHTERVGFGVRMGGMGVAIGSLVGKQLSKLMSD